jgi:hypothetical protein
MDMDILTVPTAMAHLILIPVSMGRTLTTAIHTAMASLIFKPIKPKGIITTKFRMATMTTWPLTNPSRLSLQRP